MSGQHTSGPWSYTRNPENTRWIIDSAPNHGIACTAGYECDNEANARLIASAPDLLEAVIQYRDDLKRPPTGDSIERRLAMVNAAIAKATGAAS